MGKQRDYWQLRLNGKHDRQHHHEFADGHSTDQSIRGVTMTLLADAVAMDAHDQPIPAADAYEAAIEQNADDVGLNTYLDLAVLYFECNDGGYAAYHHLSVDVLDRAWRRLYDVLDEAEERFGPHPEVDFWRRYCCYIQADGEPLDEEDALELVQHRLTLVPYFYLFGSFTPNGARYVEQARALFALVKGGRTVKERYIRSVLASAFQRYGIDP